MADSFPEIKHVVLLILENRSFDHMLGGLPGVDGASPVWTNSDGQRAYAQTPIEHSEQDDARTVNPDPKHETPNVLRQIQSNNAGFVADYAETHPDTTPGQRQKIMSYYPDGALGPLHVLATNFAVCQRWHASVPGPTLVSPWLARQVVDAPCDHTSLLRSLSEKWELGPLGARTAQATDVFAQLQQAPALRTDTPKNIGMDLPGESASPEPDTDHKKAVIRLAEHLDPTPGLTPRQRIDNFLARGGPPSVESP